jgi:hypothetical protein
MRWGGKLNFDLFIFYFLNLFFPSPIPSSLSPSQFLSFFDYGVDINRELERLIGGHERGGQVTFQDFIKYLGLYHEGDVRYQFSEERVDPRATLNLFQAVNIVRTPTLACCA